MSKMEELAEAKYDTSYDPPLLLNFDELFTVVKRLGSGGYGEVDLITSKVTGVNYALKSIHDRYSFINERNIMEIIADDNPNIIYYYASFTIPKGYYLEHGLLLEYVSGESINDIINNNFKFPIDQLVDIVRQLFSALAWLHGNELYHNDIKGANILIQEDGSLRLIDFGEACFDGDCQVERYAYNEAEAYYSPLDPTEDIQGYKASVDTYKAATVVKALIDGKYPEELHWVGERQLALIPLSVNSGDVDLDQAINGALNVDASQRLTSVEVRDILGE